MDESDGVNLDDNTEQEHLHNYKAISAALRIHEDSATECIKAIPDEEYTEEAIIKCTGPHFLMVITNIHYENMRIISKADTKIRQFFTDQCYLPASQNEDEDFSNSCDILEKDCLDLLWGGLEFQRLLILNKPKYI